MEAVAVNRVDLAKVPDRIVTELCRGAIEMAIRHRSDPEYQKRYQAWLSEQASPTVTAWC